MIDALDKVLHHDDTKKKTKKKKDNDPCERKTGSWVVISMGRVIASRSCLVVSYKKGKCSSHLIYNTSYNICGSSIKKEKKTAVHIQKWTVRESLSYPSFLILYWLEDEWEYS